MLVQTETRPGPVRHLIYGLNPVISVLREAGIDPGPLLDQAGIPIDDLGDPECFLDPRQELSFMELGLSSLDQPDLGLHIGQRYHLSAYGMLGLAAMTSANLVEAFRVIFKNILMTWTYMHWSLRTEDGQAIVALDKQRDLGGCYQFMIDRGLSAGYTIAREALGIALPLLEVNVKQAHPAYADSYSTVFGCPVNFAAKNNDLRFEEHYLKQPLQQSETESARIFAGQCEKICEALAKGGSFAELIRQHLLQLPNQIDSLENIANRLHTTPRTIQRKLAAEDTSYLELAENVRKNLAIEYLRSTGLTIEEIALRLGYVDAPSFSHAFKRWTGASPGSMR